MEPYIWAGLHVWIYECMLYLFAYFCMSVCDVMQCNATKCNRIACYSNASKTVLVYTWDTVLNHLLIGIHIQVHKLVIKVWQGWPYQTSLLFVWAPHINPPGTLTISSDWSYWLSSTSNFKQSDSETRYWYYSCMYNYSICVCMCLCVS